MQVMVYLQIDYKWNEILTSYDGKIYSKKEDLPNDTSYVLNKGRVYIDGKVNFGESKRRYINAPPKGIKANYKWGSTKLGHDIIIRIISKPKGVSKLRTIAVYEGEEFFISYGSGYWKQKKRNLNTTSK